MRAILAALFICVFVVNADARGHHKHHRPFHGAQYTKARIGHRHTSVLSVSYSRPSDCYGIPWCGCWLRHYLGVASRAFNLAREWVHYGHATSPHIGAVVVWPHHVGLITGGSPGNWIVTSGNDGHAVRSRRRSVAGAIAFRDRA